MTLPLVRITKTKKSGPLAIFFVLWYFRAFVICLAVRLARTALAWNLKAWWALWPTPSERWYGQHRHEQSIVLRMEFKTFVNAFVRIPCQIVRTGRKLIYRVLNWNPWQRMFFRTFAQLRC